MDDYSARIRSLPHIKRVLELVGLTAITWNEVDLVWYLIYTGLLHGTPRDTVDKIYQHFVTGSAKREFTLGLADHIFAKHPDIRQSMGWLNGITGELSGLRNAIVHADYFLHASPDIGVRIGKSEDWNRRPNQFAKYDGKQLPGEIEAVINRIDAHIRQLDDFRLYLVQNFIPMKHGPYPWPEERLAGVPDELRSRLPKEFRIKIALPMPPAKSAKKGRRKS